MNKEEQAKYIIQQLGIKLPDKYIGGKYDDDDGDDGPDNITEIPLEIERSILSFLDIKNKKDVNNILNYASVNKTALERYTKGGEYIEGLKSSIIYEFVDIYKMFNGDFTKNDTEFIRSVSREINNGDSIFLQFIKKKSQDKNQLIYLKDKDNTINFHDEYIQYIKNIKELEIKYLFGSEYNKDMKNIKKLDVDAYGGTIDNFSFQTLESLSIGYYGRNVTSKFEFLNNIINNNENLKELKIDFDIDIKTLKLFKKLSILKCIIDNINNMDILFENNNNYMWHELDITIKHNLTKFNKSKNFNDFLKNIKTLKTLKIKTNPSPFLQIYHEDFSELLSLEDIGFTTKNLNIEYLKIEDSLIKDDDLSKLNNLKYLKLVNNVIHKIEKFLYLDFKTVKYLYYQHKKFQDSDNHNLLLTTFKNLDTLILKNITINNKFKSIDIVSKNKTDTILMINENNDYEKYQKTFQIVKVLELYDCDFDMDIFKYLKNIYKLSIISNSNKSYGISTDTLIYILKNTNIKKLTLINCSHVDERIFKYIKNLKYLCIENCKFISERIIDYVHEDTVFKFVLHDMQKNGPKTENEIKSIELKKSYDDLNLDPYY